MKIVIPKEYVSGERRVPVIPSNVKQLVKLGAQVEIETGMGDPSGYADDEYASAGATVNRDRKALLSSADVVLHLHKPPIEEIDVHDPKRLLSHVDFTPEVWEAFDELKSWGLVDIFRKHHPGESNQFAFFDYRVPRAVDRGLGWRVDHLLATLPLAEKSSDSFIDLEPRRAEKPSDHTVMIAEFTL